MDFEFTLEERALAKTVRDFVDERVEPQMREIEEKNQIPEELLAEAANFCGAEWLSSKATSKLARFSIPAFEPFWPHGIVHQGPG